MSVSIIHCVNQQGRTAVSEERLLAIWRQIEAEGKVESLFYAGGVAGPDDFRQFVTAQDERAMIAVEAVTGRVRGLAWLTNTHDGSAFLHYCALGGFSRGVARDLIAYLEGWRKPDGQPFLDRLLGITPEVNAAALRVLAIMGFTTLGTIPGYCRLAHRGERCGGVISFYECRKPPRTPDGH